MVFSIKWQKFQNCSVQFSGTNLHACKAPKAICLNEIPFLLLYPEALPLTFHLFELCVLTLIYRIFGELHTHMPYGKPFRRTSGTSPGMESSTLHLLNLHLSHVHMAHTEHLHLTFKSRDSSLVLSPLVVSLLGQWFRLAQFVHPVIKYQIPHTHEYS